MTFLQNLYRSVFGEFGARNKQDASGGFGNFLRIFRVDGGSADAEGRIGQSEVDGVISECERSAALG